MIKVTARIYLKEGCLDEYLAIAKELVEKTNLHDKGCIRYELCRDVNNPLNLVMLEDWEDEASIQAHMQAPHFTELIGKLDALSAKPTDVSILAKIF